MAISLWAVLVCGVLAMVIGSIWYGPLFGKKWAHIIGCDNLTPEQQKEMQKGMWKFYLTQFILVLFQVYILANYIKGLSDVAPVSNALWIWAGFIMPTIAGAVLWSGEDAKKAWARFWIMAGYNFVLFVVFGLVLGA